MTTLQWGGGGGGERDKLGYQSRRIGEEGISTRENFGQWGDPGEFWAVGEEGISILGKGYRSGRILAMRARESYQPIRVF